MAGPGGYADFFKVRAVSKAECELPEVVLGSVCWLPPALHHVAPALHPTFPHHPTVHSIPPHHVRSAQQHARDRGAPSAPSTHPNLTQSHPDPTPPHPHPLSNRFLTALHSLSTPSPTQPHLQPPPNPHLPQVRRLLQKHMRRKKLGAPCSKAGTNATVREVVSGLLEFQGVRLVGDGYSEMARVAQLIVTAVQESKEGRSPRRVANQRGWDALPLHAMLSSRKASCKQSSADRDSPQTRYRQAWLAAGRRTSQDRNAGRRTSQEWFAHGRRTSGEQECYATSKEGRLVPCNPVRDAASLHSQQI